MTSRFLTELECKLLRGQFKQGRPLWQLLSPLLYDSELLGTTVVVPKGYVTDFASVPRLPLTYLLAGDTAHEAAAIHDWLYTAHGVGLRPVSRREADAVFREAISASDDKAPGFLMWLAVRVGGSGAWEAEPPIQPPTVVQILDETAREAP